MHKEPPLWQRLYTDAAYRELVRRVGYRGCTWRELAALIEELGKTYGKQKVESASYRCFTFEGQMTCNPAPLAHVSLRADVRTLCWQLLGPPPEKLDAFYTNPDGTPMQRPAGGAGPRVNDGSSEGKPKKRSRKKAG